MALKLSCAFPPSRESPEYAGIAESLGYERAFLYDSPALHADVWVQLCRAAERTEQLGLGPAALVPSNRHPMTNAAAIATLVELAGEHRVTVVVGSGFTGRVAMGRRPLPWSYVTAYVRALQGLLRGDAVEWDGAAVQMLHPEGFAPPRPINVKFLIAAAGPKGEAAARDLASGVFSFPSATPGFDWSVVLAWGTVLGDAEEPDSDRVREAAGPAGAAMLHGAAEYGRLEALLDERASDFHTAYADVPEDRRHLAMHGGHLVTLNERDRPFVTGEFLDAAKLALSPSGWREKLEQLEESGATEIAYQPAGPNVASELEAFAEVARG